MEFPSFKQILGQDLNDAFMNVEEFADIHNVNGNQMPVLFDDVEIIEREKKMKSNMDGIAVRQKLIYVKAEDYGSAPIIGMAVMLDGKRHTVTDVSDEGGVYAITMEANRTI